MQYKKYTAATAMIFPMQHPNGYSETYFRHNELIEF